MSVPAKLKPLILGELPCFQLKQFGLILPEGYVAMSIAAQKHSMRNHPDDFPRCAPFLSEVVETPSLVGQSPLHTDAFELVKELHAEGLNVLVAVRIAPAPSGLYQVSSAYPLAMATIEARLRKGHLLAV